MTTTDKTPLLEPAAGANTSPPHDAHPYPPIASRVYRLFFGPPVCPPGVDPRSKFRPNGDRVFLMYQRGTTRSELFWTIATLPIHFVRWGRLPTDPVQLLEQAAHLPDPTTIVPTLDIGVEVVDQPDQSVVSARLAELRERRRKLDEENERWLTAGRSRKERLRLINRKVLWTLEGNPVFLFARRENTWLESFLSIITSPICMWRTWWSVTGAMRKAIEDGGDGPFDYGDVLDPTVVIPTGKSYYLEEELSEERPGVTKNEGASQAAVTGE